MWKGMKLSVFDVILAILFPPIAVLTKYGVGKKFWTNVGLTLLGWLPGAIHAIAVLPKSGDESFSAPL